VEAGIIHEAAERQYRTVSGYVLHTVMGAIDFENEFLHHVRKLSEIPPPGATQLARRC
jgi:hypothetical protein